MGLPTPIGSVFFELDSQPTSVDSVDIVEIVQEKLVAHDIELSNGSQLYYSDIVNGQVIATAVDGELAATRSPGCFFVPLEEVGTTTIVVTLDIEDYSLLERSCGEEVVDSSTDDNPWQRVTIADFKELLEMCALLDAPIGDKTIRDVATGMSNVMILLVTLGESLGSSLAAYYAIVHRLQKAALNMGTDHPLETISIPSPERFALWGESARMWLHTGTAIRDLYLDRPWPGWVQFSSLLAFY